MDITRGCVVALGGLVLVSLLGCGNGGAPNTAPTVVVTAPGENVEIGLSQGGDVALTYTDNDPDDVALTDLLADRDGDLATTGDQVLIVADRPEMDGAEQTVLWSVNGVAPGSYKILAFTRDAGSSAVGEAPGIVALRDTECGDCFHDSRPRLA